MIDRGIVPYQFAKFIIAFVLVYSKDSETLGLACIFPLWRVAKENVCLWFYLTTHLAVSPAQQQLFQGQKNHARISKVGFQSRYLLLCYILASGSAIFYLSRNWLLKYVFFHMQSPQSRHISQSNAQVLISYAWDHVVGLNVAHSATHLAPL